MKKTLIILIILLTIFMLQGCFKTEQYPKYSIQKIDKEPSVITSPDNVRYKYIKPENRNSKWYPEILYVDGDYEIVGEFEEGYDGYVLKTTSDISLYVDNLRGMGYFIYREGAELPGEFDEKDIGAGFYKLSSMKDDSTYYGITAKDIEEVLKICNDTEQYESIIHNKVKSVAKIVFEHKEFSGFFYGIPIYTDDTDYYFSFSYNEEKAGEIICVKCNEFVERVVLSEYQKTIHAKG